MCLQTCYPLNYLPCQLKCHINPIQDQIKANKPVRKLPAFLGILCLLFGCRPQHQPVKDHKTDWIYQVDSLLMPFWMSADAVGNPPGNFPAYRYPDGRAIDPKQIDWSILSPEYTQYYLGNTDSLRRDFIRVKSRQVYGYCIAYHITGNEAYLVHARQGLDYLISKGVYRDSSAVSFWDKDGLAQPERLQRNTQDLAYALLGPATYYYLTRDPAMLDLVLQVHNFVWREYYEKSDLQENSKLMAWVRENFEGAGTQNKELLAPLDQLNAYLLLVAGIAPDSLHRELGDRAGILAHSIHDNFYNPELNIFWSGLNQKSLDGDTDFAHSIKTFWMLYTTAKLTQDKDLENFARGGAEKLLDLAYLKESGSWASKYADTTLKLDRNTMAWHQAELDQMAATLSFEDTVFYSRYLVHTYPYFEEYMIDHKNGGTYWGRMEDGKILEVGFRSGWHMANFHDLEHALIGYLSTANYYGDAITLYYAFDRTVDPENEKVKPYHYYAPILEIERSDFQDPLLSGLTKMKVIFGTIE
ncbi:MAG: hypothetical protein EP344_11670 [Bacteroidetes bacterium]|nr:MAG: hypothetical protein EP344_11670 [Bacteroidota bacterium]